MKLKEEEDYLENVLLNIEQAEELKDLEEIRGEVDPGRLYKGQEKKEAKRSRPGSGSL